MFEARLLNRDLWGRALGGRCGMVGLEASKYYLKVVKPKRHFNKDVD